MGPIKGSLRLPFLRFGGARNTRCRRIGSIGRLMAVAATMLATSLDHPAASAAEGFGETIVESALDQPAESGASDAAGKVNPSESVAKPAVLRQAKPAAGRQHGFWAQRCRGAASGGQRCHIEHAVLDGKRRQLVRFAIADIGGVRRLIVFAPVGLRIPYGVHVRIDKLPTRQLRLETCDRRSCEAELAVDATLSRQLADGARIAILLQDGRSGRHISVAGSLHGFTAAYQRAFGGVP